MERESQLQQGPLSPIDVIAPIGTRSRFLALCLFMLLPWFWVALGLHWFKDYRLTILLYELMGCLLPVYLFQAKRHTRFFPLGLSKVRLLTLILIFNAIIIGAFSFTNYLYMDWHDFRARMQATRLLDIDWEFWVFAGMIVIINPILEEAFWRGVVYREWQHYSSQKVARLISCFFFGAWHWVVLQAYCSPFWALTLSLAVAVGGIIFTWLYDRTKTLGAATLLHGLGTDLPMAWVVMHCILQANVWGISHPN